jgi:hypothetical protein
MFYNSLRNQQLMANIGQIRQRSGGTDGCHDGTNQQGRRRNGTAQIVQDQGKLRQTQNWIRRTHNLENMAQKWSDKR